MTQDSWAVLQRQLKLDTQTRTISDIRTIIFDYLREAMTYDETAPDPERQRRLPAIYAGAQRTRLQRPITPRQRC